MSSKNIFNTEIPQIGEKGWVTPALEDLALSKMLDHETIKNNQDCMPNRLMVYALGITIWLTQSREFCLILGSMRSGTTLLKALLAEAPDISNVPEIDFQRHAETRLYWCGYHAFLTKARISVLKLPCSFREGLSYPILPKWPCRIIVLFRDPLEVITSLAAMNQVKQQYLSLTQQDLLVYWCNVYERILSAVERHPRVVYLNYETLVADPLDVTSKLFPWLGSTQRAGVSSYRAPTSFKWQWGTDDGGDQIQSLRVQSSTRNEKHDHEKLREEIKLTPRVAALWSRLVECSHTPENLRES